jgi:hypothetical protein
MSLAGITALEARDLGMPSRILHPHFVRVDDDPFSVGCYTSQIALGTTKLSSGS